MKRYNIDSLDNRDPQKIGRLLGILEPILRWYFRADVRGVERIPQGACLYVGNHNSGLLAPDMFIFAATVRRCLGIEDLPYGLGHEVTIRLPLLHQILMPLGAVRASHQNAHRLFTAGKKALVFPGGDLDAFRSFHDRNRIRFGPRRGYIKLALRANVPIVPVVSAGAHSTFIVLHDGQWLAKVLHTDRLLRYKVFPVVLSLPWGLTVGLPLPYFPLPSRIRIEILDPIRFERHGDAAAEDPDFVEECHQRVHGQMETTLRSLTQSA